MRFPTTSAAAAVTAAAVMLLFAPLASSAPAPAPAPTSILALPDCPIDHQAACCMPSKTTTTSATTATTDTMTMPKTTSSLAKLHYQDSSNATIVDTSTCHLAEPGLDCSDLGVP
ncbi:hypothetical protein B0A50_06745 [Salinomyces thailandicus]|uniref:Hydrophobin n=1 Tax=Salinomyces thailandicus TaxID=706561 RepID=A0A4U0TRL7_9PEZI|nr:hypothetical protein B0A50_06745 [Salinomyces thailandica]